jgi:hypothetical protein
MKKTWWWTIGLVLLATVAVAAGKVYNFQGGVKTRATEGITKQQLVPQPPQGMLYTWTYTFVYYLDDRSNGMIQYSYFKAGGLLYQRNFVHFSYVSPQGERTYRKDIIDNGARSWQNDPPRLVMGKHSWQGFYPDFDLHLDYGDVKADLHYHCLTPGWRPGEGPTHYGTPDGAWYDLITMIPWAEVSGTITLPGKTIKVHGNGYSDHNTQSILFTSQLTHLNALRSFGDEYAIHFLDYVAPPDLGATRTTWILVMKKGQILYATDDFQLKEFDVKKEPRYGFTYPTRLEVKIDQPECKLQGTIHGLRLAEVLDMADETPSWIRPIVTTFVTNGMFIRQQADVDWHLQMSGIDAGFTNRGIFEVAHVR